MLMHGNYKLFRKFLFAKCDSEESETQNPLPAILLPPYRVSKENSSNIKTKIKVKSKDDSACVPPGLLTTKALLFLAKLIGESVLYKVLQDEMYSRLAQAFYLTSVWREGEDPSSESLSFFLEF